MSWLSRALKMFFLLLAVPLAAQDLSGLARLDAAQSRIVDAGEDIEITLYLSQAVPYRVYTLDDPRRFVMDFREVDWTGARAEGLLLATGAQAVRFGVVRPGWSRMVLDLAGPFGVDVAGMRVDDVDGTAVVRVVLEPVTSETFAANAEDGPRVLPEQPVVAESVGPENDGVLTVVIDAGHGGLDPGAERAGLAEADLMLSFAVELAEALGRIDRVEPVLTRQDDVFIPLHARITRARQAGADVFISLHADALEEDEAQGLSVYTLSTEATQGASQRMAERHEGSDMLSGVDLTGQGDTIATALMDLARLETGPASLRLADALVTALDDAGVRLNSRPRRQGPLAVLSSPDFPSVLIELGFLSNANDRARLTDPAARARMVEGIVAGLVRWQAAEAIRAPLIRQ